ncbi:ribosomal-processing cysteine protease Prp [Spiroplasma chinense]|uniref:Ribosomal processing cysteine protease Prp n=1 Tax=Spiroplasma chinense TaxID=216932 RepID=A0A5B9Y3G0_9MOLU|nr:ribosomal-processing cysteine protease Prp [Spiroplasma chinense]QEH61584.1 ribosomal-processing cysteine protease Prp [Spiroplasma chinense]
MVKAKIKYNDDSIMKIEVSGHANAGDYGNDLVCAGITAIVSGALNGLDQMHNKDVDLNVDDNVITIIVKNDSIELQKILQFLLFQLETIEFQYQKNFKIEEVF